MSTLAPSRDVWAPRDMYRRLERKRRNLKKRESVTAESRAAARVQVVVVDERGELAIDSVLDRRVHGAVDVSRELRDQPGLHLGPEAFVGIAPV